MSARRFADASDSKTAGGNNFDKYGSPNPVVNWMMRGFDAALSDFVAKASPRSIHDVGCGEGAWVIRWNEQGLPARGSDVSERAVERARLNAVRYGVSPSLFERRSIYDLDAERDRADLLVCCEVLEHLARPEAALQALQRTIGDYLIVSVPREPLWRALNLARGAYVTRLGNTPGHVNHWSKRGIVNSVSRFFDVVGVKSPLPWSMLLCRRAR